MARLAASGVVVTSLKLASDPDFGILEFDPAGLAKVDVASALPYLARLQESMPLAGCDEHRASLKATMRDLLAVFDDGRAHRCKRRGPLVPIA